MELYYCNVYDALQTFYVSAQCKPTGQSELRKANHSFVCRKHLSVKCVVATVHADTLALLTKCQTLIM